MSRRVPSTRRLLRVRGGPMTVVHCADCGTVTDGHPRCEDCEVERRSGLLEVVRQYMHYGHEPGALEPANDNPGRARGGAA